MEVFEAEVAGKKLTGTFEPNCYGTADRSYLEELA